jgi:hypothetical protein
MVKKMHLGMVDREGMLRGAAGEGALKTDKGVWWWKKPGLGGEKLCRLYTLFRKGQPSIEKTVTPAFLLLQKKDNPRLKKP